MQPKRPLRWIIPVAYVLSLDSFLLLILFSSAFNLDGAGALESTLTALTITGGILLVANIVQCIVLHATNAPYRRTFSRRVMLLMKIGLIPFFLLGGLVMSFLMLLSIHPVLAFVGWMSLPLAGAIGWAAMMSGSAWAIAYALGLYRDRLMSAGECVAHVLLQLFFFADVIDAIVLFVRGRKKEARFWQGAPAQGGFAPSQGALAPEYGTFPQGASEPGGAPFSQGPSIPGDAAYRQGAPLPGGNGPQQVPPPPGQTPFSR